MAATQHTLLYSRRFTQVGTPSTSGKKSFKILSYNILAQCLVKRAIFPYTSGATLKWKLRKQNLLNELKVYDADICCLQELDQFDYWGPEFDKMGYDVLYNKKDGGQHGLGILWKRNRFNLIASEMIQLDNSPLTHPTPVYPITQNIALLAFLKDEESGESITISNHHLYWRPDATYVRTRQLYVILKNLVGFNAKCGGYRMLMCGDFNAIPSSPEYFALTKQKMNSLQLLELEPKSLGDSFGKSLAPKAESNNLPSAGTSSPPNGSCENLNSLPVENPLPVPVLLSHFDALPACHSLYSSYKFCFESDWDRAAAASKAVSGGFDGCFLSSTEPAFTNYTPGFRGCLDYIFNVASCIRESDDAENARVVAAQKDCGLKVLKMLQFPEVEEYQKTFLPNEKWSSDHFALMLELEYA